jgi:hypothetical protein
LLAAIAAIFLIISIVFTDERPKKNTDDEE